MTTWGFTTNLIGKTAQLSENINTELDSVTEWDFWFPLPRPTAPRAKIRMFYVVRREPVGICWQQKQTGKEYYCSFTNFLDTKLYHISPLTLSSGGISWAVAIGIMYYVQNEVTESEDASFRFSFLPYLLARCSKPWRVLWRHRIWESLEEKNHLIESLHREHFYWYIPPVMYARNKLIFVVNH